MLMDMIRDFQFRQTSLKALRYCWWFDGDVVALVGLDQHVAASIPCMTDPTWGQSEAQDFPPSQILSQAYKRLSTKGHVWYTLLCILF